MPVREAFRRLEAQGLAVSEPRRGVWAVPFDTRTREVAEMRAALEVPRCAMQPRTSRRQRLMPPNRSHWKATSHAMSEAREDVNRRFHRFIQNHADAAPACSHR